MEWLYKELYICRNTAHKQIEIERLKIIRETDILFKIMNSTTEGMNESTAADGDSPSYSELVKMVNEIANPLAGKKLTKALHKTMKKAVKVKSIKRGVREVTKGLRKGEKGIVVLAGDVTPIDVYSHLPVMCEDRNVPYCYVPSKMNLGTAVCSKRPTCVVMIRCHDNFKDKYEKCFAEVKSLPLPF